MIRLSPVAIALLLIHSPCLALADQPQDPILVSKANQYQDDIDLNQYWYSEKLDGIRAVWTGKQLVTQTGNLINAPQWFTRSLPEFAVEGELWAGRGRFHQVQTTIFDQHPDSEAWRTIHFMAFDLPSAEGDYQRRYKTLTDWTAQLAVEHIRHIPQLPISSRRALFKVLDEIDQQNGEGIMLRKVDSVYRTGRSDDLLKLKKFQDAEATVIGYRPGKGKYVGKMGALLVRMSNGVEFAIGSGFTDQQRGLPPELGSVVTFRYSGSTHNGVPRFARFIRERDIINNP
ncbi:DNA ligase [Vibrio sp.]|uniref:DNA ligase n=1 Tax=Vibrio sp. TaxID=678 RepID=UPI003D0D80CB